MWRRLKRRSEDEIVQYDEVITRFGAASEPELREHVALAMINKGVTLDQLGRNEDAVAQYDEVIARFGSASETGLKEQVARALQNKVRLHALKIKQPKP